MNRPNDAYWVVNVPIEEGGDYALTKEEREKYKKICKLKFGMYHNRIFANLIKKFVRENSDDN